MISLRNSFIVFCLLVVGCDNHLKNKNEESSVPDTTSIVSDTPEVEPPIAFDSLVSKYEDPERRSWQNPELVINKLGDLKGKTVADIGAGTGYFTFKLAPYASKVLAIDIDDRFLEYIEDQKRDLPSELSDKIEVRLSEENDPLLNKNEIDVALLVNTYYFIPNRIEYLNKVQQALKPGGKIAIVDFKDATTPSGPPIEYHVDAKTAQQELKTAGFKKISTDTTSLKYQYIIIAQ